jgi:hypothetical protein
MPKRLEATGGHSRSNSAALGGGEEDAAAKEKSALEDLVNQLEMMDASSSSKKQAS